VTDYELLRIGSLLTATIARIYTDRMSWPCTSREFALAVDVCKDRGNELAVKLRTTDGSTGRWCPDFEQMVTLIHSSCQIEYRTSGFNRFWVLVGQRFLMRTFSTATPKEQLDASDLVQAWKRVELGENP